MTRLKAKWRLNGRHYYGDIGPLQIEIKIIGNKIEGQRFVLRSVFGVNAYTDGNADLQKVIAQGERIAAKLAAELREAIK